MTREPTVLLKTRCSTCIYYNEGERMHLEVGRVAEMTQGTIAADSNVICHQSEDLTGDLPFNAYCRGNYDEKGPGQMMRIAERLGMLTEESPRKEAK